MNVLNSIPAAAQPFFWPILGIVLALMGFGALVSIGNPGLRSEIKAHVVWIVVAAVLVFSGGALVAKFLADAGVPGASTTTTATVR